MGEAAGLEFLVPLARWHGYGGETDTDGPTSLRQRMKLLTAAARTLARSFRIYSLRRAL